MSRYVIGHRCCQSRCYRTPMLSVKVCYRTPMLSVKVCYKAPMPGSHHRFICPLTARVVRAPQMISQPVSSIFPCSPLPSGTSRTPGLSILCCCLPISSSAWLVFFPLSLCLAIWFWPDLMNGRHDHITAVCVSLRSSGLHVVRLPAGSWHGLPRW